MKILVFTKNGGVIPPFPQRLGLQYQHVRFESTTLDDLLLIAEYRVIHFPMSIIIDGKGKVLMKVKGTIPDAYVDNLLESN